MKTFAMGDIHGHHRALWQCLDRSGFDREDDRLIQLGDVSDRGPQTAQCVETLLEIKNLVAIRGNHDCWTHDYFVVGSAPDVWIFQGGRETLASYIELSLERYGEGKGIHPEIFQRHKEFYQRQVDWFIDEENRVCIHQFRTQCVHNSNSL